MFRGKKYKEIAKQIDKAALYDPKEGLELICMTSSAFASCASVRSPNSYMPLSPSTSTSGVMPCLCTA